MDEADVYFRCGDSGTGGFAQLVVVRGADFRCHETNHRVLCGQSAFSLHDPHEHANARSGSRGGTFADFVARVRNPTLTFMKDKPISIMTRRRFMRQAACAALGTGALTSAVQNLRFMNAAVAQSLPSDYKALVCIFLSGGNDSNNLV